MKGLVLLNLFVLFSYSVIIRESVSESVYQDLRVGFFERRVGRGYFVSHSTPARLYEVNVDTFQTLREKILDLNLATSIIYSAKTNRFFIGFNTITGGVILKLDLATLNIEGRVRTFHNPQSLALDDSLDILYAGTRPVKGVGSAIHKINATNLAVLDTIELSPNDGIIETLQLDTSRHYLYAGTDTSPATIIRLWAEPTLRRMDVMSFPQNWNQISSSLIDSQNQYVYFGILGTVGRIVKIDLESFRWVDTITTGTKGPISAIMDAQRGYSYWTSNEIPSVVQVVRMCDFQLLEVANFYSKERLPRAAIMDVWRGKILYGTSCFGDEPCREPCNLMVSFRVSGTGSCANSQAFAQQEETNTYSTVVNIRLGGMFPRGASCCAAENAFFPGTPTIWNPQVSTLPTNVYNTNHATQNQRLRA